jgi:hypothetical protein
MTQASQLTGLQWPALLLGSLTVSGAGICTVTSTVGLKVGASIQFINGALSHLFLVKAVLSDTTFLVYDSTQPTGTIGDPLQTIVNPVAYSGGTANVPQQERGSKGDVAVLRSVFEEAPTTALRSVAVDAMGNYITASNPLPVAAEVTVGPVTAVVALDAFTKVPPDNVEMVGTENGTTTGTKHVAKIDTLGNLQVADVNKLVPKVYDYLGVTNTVINGLTLPATVLYKTGGSGGTTVATLTLTYDGLGNFLTVTRT